MSVFFAKRGPAPSYGPPVGTTWLFETNGAFTVPVDGVYEVEMHGGGGGGGKGNTSPGEYAVSMLGGGGGGGSGTIKTLVLRKGDIKNITIGAGGSASKSGAEVSIDNGGPGGTTTFGEWSIAGGGAGTGCKPDYSWPETGKGGAASGEIATAGANGTSLANNVPPAAAGGYGNKNNPSQKYGNGGAGGCGVGNNATIRQGKAGQPGAVIITYLGKE